MKYYVIQMNWDSFTYPIAKGTPIAINGILANDASAVGIIPQTIKAKPSMLNTRILVGGEVNVEELDYTLSDAAIKAMDGISFIKDGTRYPNVYVDGYVLPAATASKLGGVKMAANVAASEATDVAGCVTSINAILSALKTAGIMVADAE